MTHRTPTRASERLRVEIALHRCGWIPLLIAVILISAAGAHWMCTASERAAHRHLHQRLAQPIPAGEPATGPARADSARQGIAQVQAMLPQPQAANALVGELFDIAQREGLQLERSTFQHALEDAGLPWLRVSLTLPVRGPYPAVRGFIETVLREHPNVALNHLSVKRETSAEEQAHVVLGFSAWFASPAVATPEGQP